MDVTKSSSSLTDADLRMLQASYIDMELVQQAGLFRVDSPEGARLVGRNGGRADYAGIVFPYRWPGEEKPREYRLRRDFPDLEEQPNGLPPKEKGKYLSPPGRGNKLYFPPNIDPADLENTQLPIVIVEGEKKCLAMHRLSHESGERFLPIGLAVSGVGGLRLARQMTRRVLAAMLKGSFLTSIESSWPGETWALSSIQTFTLMKA